MCVFSSFFYKSRGQHPPPQLTSFVETGNSSWFVARKQHLRSIHSEEFQDVTPTFFKEVVHQDFHLGCTVLYRVFIAAWCAHTVGSNSPLTLSLPSPSDPEKWHSLTTTYLQAWELGTNLSVRLALLTTRVTPLPTSHTNQTVWSRLEMLISPAGILLLVLHGGRQYSCKP